MKETVKDESAAEIFSKYFDSRNENGNMFRLVELARCDGVNEREQIIFYISCFIFRKFPISHDRASNHNM